MADEFRDYARAVADSEVAEQQANEIVNRIKNILSPLFTNWKLYCLSGLPEPIPHVLTKLGSPINTNRRQIDVGSLTDDLGKMQSFMAKYAEAMETAMAAYGQIPPDQRARLGPAPWHGSEPYKLG